MTLTLTDTTLSRYSSFGSYKSSRPLITHFSGKQSQSPTTKFQNGVRSRFFPSIYREDALMPVHKDSRFLEEGRPVLVKLVAVDDRMTFKLMNTMGKKQEGYEGRTQIVSGRCARRA
jgi:hypothetical protein